MWRLKEALCRRSTFGVGGSSKRSKKSHPDAGPAMPGSTMNAPARAVQTVLKTPELFDMILSHVHPDQVLQSQRVCRQWRDFIMTSTQLQRRLYLSPTTRINESIAIDNHWLKTRFPDLGVYLLQGNPKWRPKVVRALNAPDMERVGLDFFSGPAVSWRKMLLTQPPIKEVVVYAQIDDATKGAWSTERRGSTASLFTPPSDEMMRASVTVKSDTGVTMGMLLDASMEANKRAFAAARHSIASRKDSGYVTQGECNTDHINIAVVEIIPSP